jgi:hypothetical protein
VEKSGQLLVDHAKETQYTVALGSF